MKLLLTWFNITNIIKRSSHSFDMLDDKMIPMLETKELNRNGTRLIKAYLGTFKKYTKQL